MSGTVMLNAKVLIGGYNFSGIHNSVALEYGAEMLDETVFQDGVNSNTRKNKAGLKTFSFSGNAFWDDVVDAVQYQNLGGDRQVMTFANVGEREGDVVFITRGITYTYNPLSGEIGALLQATIEGRNSNEALVRGRMMKYGEVTASGNTVGLNTGPIEGKRIVMAFHVFEPLVAAGGSVTAVIESAPDASFAAPTVRLTSAALSAKGADWQEAFLPYGVTDGFWRARWTVAGGPFKIAISFGWV